MTHLAFTPLQFEPITGKMIQAKDVEMHLWLPELALYSESAAFVILAGWRVQYEGCIG